MKSENTTDKTRYYTLLFLSLLVIEVLILIIIDLSRFTYEAEQVAEVDIELDHIIIDPEEVILEIGENRKVSAFAANKSGQVLKNLKVEWSIGDSVLASIDSLGNITALESGFTVANVSSRGQILFGETTALERPVHIPSRPYHRPRESEFFNTEEEELNKTPGQLVAYRTVSKTIRVTIIPEGMVYVPAGHFIMGHTDPELFNAYPQRQVYLDGFLIDKYEVTNEQFAEFLNNTAGGYYDRNMQIKYSGINYYPFAGKANFPVTYVSWIAAQAYADYVDKRLPTEAEWEKTARGDEDDRFYPGGDQISAAMANFRNSGDPYELGTTPVGFYNGLETPDKGFNTLDSPSPYGAYDMAGNVHEWVSDWYHNEYYKYGSLNNPQGPEQDVERSIRGGSWFDIPDRLTVFHRTSGYPELKNEMVGFRCAKSIYQNDHMTSL